MGMVGNTLTINTITNIRAENDSIRRKREEEEKVAKQHQEVRI